MKKLLALLVLALPLGMQAYNLGETKKNLTIINNDNVRHELHGKARGVTWKFYIQPKEHISENLPIPADATSVSIVNGNTVSLEGGVGMVIIDNGQLGAVIVDDFSGRGGR